jgi:exonuclease III
MATLNVQGITASKLANIMCWQRDERLDIVVLTETRAATDLSELARRTPGVHASCSIHTCPGSGSTGGVAVLLGRACQLSAPVRFTALDGGQRVLRLDLTLLGQQTSLVAVYAPAATGERANFYSNVLPGYLPLPGSPLLMVGDFNCVSCAADCIYADPDLSLQPSSSRLVGSAELGNIVQQHGLRDVWRGASPEGRVFTHWSASAQSGARLDRWYANGPFLAAFRAVVSHGPAAGITTDHVPVVCDATINAGLSGAVTMGKGLQGFPLSLLNSPAAMPGLRAKVEDLAAELDLTPDADLVAGWGTFKALILGHGRTLRCDLAKQERAAAAELARQAENARSALSLAAALGGGVSGLVAASLDADSAVSAAAARRAGEFLQAGGALEHVLGDQPSYYFSSLTKLDRQRCLIGEMCRPAGGGSGPGAAPGAAPRESVTLTSMRKVGRVLGFAVEHYSSPDFGVFSRPPADPAARGELLQNLTMRLTPDLASLAEGPEGRGPPGEFTLDELKLALARTERGTAPGIDGLPYEFYRAFADVLLPRLLRVLNAAFRSTQEAPLASMLKGVICLVHKSGKPASEMSSYRPIMLLGCDAKLAMSMASARLQRPLDHVIDIAQSAFMLNRDITDNVRYHLGLGARLEELGLPGWLVLSDLAQAYDSVDRPLVAASMVELGFSPAGIVRWCRILLNGSKAAVRINGFLSPDFAMQSGLFQGSALSCQEWVVVLQPLMSYFGKLQSTGRLSTFALPSGRPAPAVMAYADDTKAVTTEPAADAASFASAYGGFALGGGASQSMQKTVILPLTPAAPDLQQDANGNHSATGYKIATKARLLGVIIGGGPPDALRVEAFAQAAGGMHAAALAWKALSLSLVGRVRAAALLSAKAVYQMAFAAPAATQLVAMQRAVNSLVSCSDRREEETPFNGGGMHPGAQIMRLPASAGGLGHVDLGAMSTALLAKAVWRSLVYTAHPWAELFRHEVKRAGTPRPGLPPGEHWPVTSPGGGGSPAAIRSHHNEASVRAFLQLGIERIVIPDRQCFESVMKEHVFPEVPAIGAAPPAISQLRSAEAACWLTMRQIRRAHLRRGELTDDEQLDLELILNGLPSAWRVEVERQSEPPAAWWEISVGTAGALPVLAGPDPGGAAADPAVLWHLLPTGRLERMAGDAPQAPCGRPALVTYRLKPQCAWSGNDYAHSEAQASREPSEREPVMEPWLVGVWEDLCLDPRVWGFPSPHGGGQGAAVSLLSMRVRDARLRIGDLRARAAQGADKVIGYGEARAAWPAAWAVPAPAPSPALPASQSGPIAGLPEVRLRSMGLAGQEERWRRSSQALADRVPPGELDLVPAWLRPPGERAAPRLGPGDRSAARAATPSGPPAAALPAGFGDVWKRLQDPTLHRPHRIACWRILHACLGCNAFLTHVRYRARAPLSAADLGVATTAACCGAACCSPPADGGPGQLETLTHCFLECPEARPAVEWLGAAWVALGGAQVPLFADVILADNLEAWPGAPSCPRTLCQWTRLRVAVIGAIWQERCSRDRQVAGEGSLARRAVSAAVATVAGAVQRDWARATRGSRALVSPSAGVGAVDWWRGFDASISMAAFKRQWVVSPPIFCSVVEPAAGGDGGGSLVMLLELATSPAPTQGRLPALPP